MEAREVARFARKKARQLAAAAANMGLPDDRARLIGYAKVLEEEAVKLEQGGSGGRSSDCSGGYARRSLMVIACSRS